MAESLTERIKQALAERPDDADLVRLAKGVAKAHKLYNDAPTVAKNRTCQKLEEELTAYLDGATGPVRFASVKEVLGYLQESRKIRQAKLYADIKKGYLRKQLDGTFRRSDVDGYATTLDALALDARVVDDMTDLARQEQEERVLKLREQRQSLAFDRALKEGKYIPRDDVALELAARATALSIGLRSALTVAAPELVAAVQGDKDQVDALVDALETHLDAALHEYSRPMVFDVAVEEDVQAEVRHDD